MVNIPVTRAIDTSPSENRLVLEFSNKRPREAALYRDGKTHASFRATRGLRAINCPFQGVCKGRASGAEVRSLSADGYLGRLIDGFGGLC
jgi:hypothetical protein